MSPPGLRIAVYGLGEAGSAIATDLAAAGAAVTGYDPRGVPDPEGVTRFTDPVDAVLDARLVLAVTAAEDATGALAQALRHIPSDTLYADLSTASPKSKRALGDSATAAGLSFVDVALMSPVPGKGLRTPELASGPGATRYAAMLRPLGAPVEVVGDQPGAAATRKLLRSVVIKGLAGLIIEAMRSATAADLEAATWADLVGQFEEMDEAFLRRLVDSTGAHAVRRLHEMEAAAELLEELGGAATLTRATVETLRRVPVEGLPELPC